MQKTPLKKKKLNLKNRVETARSLAEKGHEWVVIKSLHLICGHCKGLVSRNSPGQGPGRHPCGPRY